MRRIISVTEPSDFGAGLFFAAVGSGIVWHAQSYDMGSLLSMGPAFYPTILGALLIVIGMVLLVRAVTVAGPRLEPTAWGVLALIALPVASFGWLVQRIGLVVTTLGLVIIVRLASGERRFGETLLLSIGLAVFATLVFAVGLKLPFLIWPWER